MCVIQPCSPILNPSTLTQYGGGRCSQPHTQMTQHVTTHINSLFNMYFSWIKCLFV